MTHSGIPFSFMKEEIPTDAVTWMKPKDVLREKPVTEDS